MKRVYLFKNEGGVLIHQLPHLSRYYVQKCFSQWKT